MFFSFASLNLHKILFFTHAHVHGIAAPRKAFVVAKFISLFATAISHMRESQKQQRGTSHSLFILFILYLTSPWEM